MRKPFSQKILCSRLLRNATLVAAFMGISLSAYAQMPGPGAKRDMEKIREMERQSVLKKDSVYIREVVTVVDPETGGQEEQIVISTYSVFDYCQLILGMSEPDKLLDGQPHEITDPATYEPMMIKWNQEAAKIDTIK